jgi:molybdopterin converting factor subunit 1
MKITILAFGIARDIVGGSTLDAELPEKCSVGNLREILFSQYPAFQNLASLAIALNAEYAQDDQMIDTRDEVVLIPPVSGG